MVMIDDNGRILVRDYVTKLLSAAPEIVAPEATAKPYYFQSDPKTSGGYTVTNVAYNPPVGGIPGQNRPLWGEAGAKGPFFAAFSSEVLGIGGGEMLAGGGTDAGGKANSPIDPDTKRILPSYDTFFIPMRVVIRNPAK